MGILATTGIVRGSSGSTALSSMAGYETASRSVASASMASMSGSQAPSISVGGEVRAEATGAPGQESVSEQVGKIIDESQQRQGEDDTHDESGDNQGEGGQEEVQPNPKKRMWDAEKEEAERPRNKDEL